jgi:hypothetical protein
MRKLLVTLVIFGAALCAMPTTASAQTSVDLRINVGGHSRWNGNQGGYRGGYRHVQPQPRSYGGYRYVQPQPRYYGGYRYTQPQPRYYQAPAPRWYGPVNGPDYYSRYGYRPGYGYGNGVQPYSYSDPYGYTYRGPVVVPPGNHGYDVGPRVPRGFGNQIYPTPYYGR